MTKERSKQISIVDFPPELKKKVTVYTYFKKYFKNRKEKIVESEYSEQDLGDAYLDQSVILKER